MERRQQDYWRKRFERLKEENQALREKLAHLRSEQNGLNKALRNQSKLFHAIPAGIVLVQDGKIVQANRNALEYLGYGLEEVVGHDFLEFVHPDFKKPMRDLHKRRVAGKRVPSQYETDIVSKAGGRVPCEARVKRIRFNGKRAFLVNLTLLEKRRQREKALTQSVKDEALLTMASGLARKLAHDLRGMQESMELFRELAQAGDAGLLKALRGVESASGGITDTLRGLESLSMVRADPSEQVLFELRSVVKKAVSLAQSNLKELAQGGKKTIHLKTYIRSVSPILGNPEEIGEMIHRLILNAVEAMPQGGELYLTTEENGGFAHVYIQDNGAGIHDSIKDRIWDPYFTTKGKGALGLGLSLSQAIVRRHQGEIEVASQRDQGTTFTVRLPLAGTHQKGKGRSQKRRIKHARILIIGKEDIAGELLSQVLVSKGHRVVSVSSGLEGWQKLEKKNFDLVLADSAAPDVGKGMLLKRIKQQRRSLPVALMIEPASQDHIKPKMKGAVDLVIVKPLAMDSVVKEIEVLLRQGGGE